MFSLSWNSWKKVFCKLIVAVPLGLGGAPPGLTMLGSDYLKPLLESFWEGETDVSLRMEGSAGAKRALARGESPIALIISGDSPTGLGEGWRTMEWGYLVLKVAVVEQNPIPDLSVSQIGGMYISGREDGISRWGDAGLPGIWASRAVTPMLYRDRMHLYPGLFRSFFGAGAEYRPSVRMVADAEGAVSEAIGQNSSILLIPPGVSLQGLRVLPVVPRGSEIAHLPTPDNLEGGRYPLMVPIRLWVKEDRIPELRGALSLLYREDLLSQTEAYGIISLSDTTRLSYLLELEFSAD